MAYTVLPGAGPGAGGGNPALEGEPDLPGQDHPGGECQPHRAHTVSIWQNFLEAF